MVRKMYDSINPIAIPSNAQMVAGYIDGSTYKWPESAWSRFPNSVKVRIARRVTTNDGHVLDVESGIPTVWPPSRAIVDWVLMRRKAGIEPTIYCNQLNDWPGIKKLFNDAGVRQPNYWVSRYNNVQDIPTGAIAKQYANSTLAGGAYDLSVVADYWPGVDGEKVVDMDWNERHSYKTPDPNSTWSEDHSVGEIESFNYFVNSWTWSGVQRIESKLDILTKQVSDDEANILTAFRSGITAVFSPEQMQELKTAIREAESDEDADRVVNAFWERLAPGTGTNPNA